MFAIIGGFKEHTDKFMGPIAKYFEKSKLNPNFLTLIGLIPIFVAGYFFYYGNLLWGLLFLILSSMADIFDGLLARASNRVTSFGGFLDSLIDRYSDLVIFGSLILGGRIEKVFLSGDFWGLLAITGALLTSYSRALSEKLKVDQAGVGWIERQERLLIFGFMALLASFHDDLKILLTYSIILLAILGNLTVIQRVYYFYKKSICKFSLNFTYKEYLKEGPVDEDLKEIFKKNKQHLSGEAKISIIRKKIWEINDGKVKYRIEQSKKELNIFELSSINTK